MILENVSMLFREYPWLHKHIRTPVIPGFNDTEEDIAAISRFLQGRNNYSYELLPYHRFGERKYELLGREIPNLPKELNEEKFKKMKKYEDCFKKDRKEMS
ncbi:MAG: hypothetical protein LUF92_12835 [Clostridiales bacterium]|nr:hypothetical protein [Clostridiales bacterium]